MSYTRIHRLLRIITLLQSGRRWKAPALALECGVDERTIYRDLNELEGAGVPCHFDKSADGYAVRGDFYLPPVQLTPEEALALSALCEEIGRKEQIPFLRAAFRAMEKIEAQLPASLQREIGLLDGHVAIRTAQANLPDGYADVYERIRGAIAARKALRCSYDSASGPERETEVFRFDPYCLFFCVRAWYAVGRHWGRDGVRTLKLSRFTQVTPTDEAYEAPDDFSLHDHLGHAWRMIRGEKDHEVEIWFDPSFAQTMSDTLWHPTQTIEQHADGSATFRCTVSGLDEIVWWALGMGPHCIVRAPEELRERLASLAARTAAHYAPGA